MHEKATPSSKSRLDKKRVRGREREREREIKWGDKREREGEREALWRDVGCGSKEGGGFG